MSSRIRLLADQIRLGTTEGGAGDLIFETMLIGGVSGTGLRSALIGDLIVDTLQLENESVTLPNIETLASTYTTVSPFTTYVTILEDDFEVTSVEDSTIYLQVQSDVYHAGQGTSDPPLHNYVRLLYNDSTVLGEWAVNGGQRFTEFTLIEVAATGSAQSFNFKWQTRSELSGPTNVYALSMLRVAMKR